MDFDPEDEPALSAETLRALEEFRREQKESQLLSSERRDVSEDWQLSQFWYDEATCRTLAEEVVRASEDQDWVACVSCPSLYKALVENCKPGGTDTVERGSLPQNTLRIVLFEYDPRFEAVAGENFVLYDYNNPENIPPQYHGKFSYIALDPPFLSEECLGKVAQTVNLLANQNSKTLLCTGEIMEDVAQRLLRVRKTKFLPVHKSKLSNTFRSYLNYDAKLLDKDDTPVQ